MLIVFICTERMLRQIFELFIHNGNHSKTTYNHNEHSNSQIGVFIGVKKVFCKRNYQKNKTSTNHYFGSVFLSKIPFSSTFHCRGSAITIQTIDFYRME